MFLFVWPRTHVILIFLLFWFDTSADIGLHMCVNSFSVLAPIPILSILFVASLHMKAYMRVLCIGWCIPSICTYILLLSQFARYTIFGCDRSKDYEKKPLATRSDTFCDVLSVTFRNLILYRSHALKCIVKNIFHLAFSVKNTANSIRLNFNAILTC